MPSRCTGQAPGARTLRWPETLGVNHEAPRVWVRKAVQAALPGGCEIERPGEGEPAAEGPGEGAGP